MTFYVDFKHFGQNIQTFEFFEKSDLPSLLFAIEKSLLECFCTKKFYLLTDFQNFGCTFYDKFGYKYC